MTNGFKVFGSLDVLPKEYFCLAFDLGRSSTGIALGDSISKSGKSIGVIKMQNFFPQSWQEIDAIIIKWQINLMIVGEPLDTPKTANKMLGFAKKIHALYSLPVVLIDESYTTVTAKQELFEHHGYNRTTKSDLDSHSALILVRHWFDLYA